MKLYQAFLYNFNLSKTVKKAVKKESWLGGLKPVLSFYKTFTSDSGTKNIFSFK